MPALSRVDLDSPLTLPQMAACRPSKGSHCLNSLSGKCLNKFLSPKKSLGLLHTEHKTEEWLVRYGRCIEHSSNNSHSHLVIIFFSHCAKHRGHLIYSSPSRTILNFILPARKHRLEKAHCAQRGNGVAEIKAAIWPHNPWAGPQAS